MAFVQVKMSPTQAALVWATVNCRLNNQHDLGKRPGAVKAPIVWQCLSARLKSCPDTELSPRTLQLVFIRRRNLPALQVKGQMSATVAHTSEACVGNIFRSRGSKPLLAIEMSPTQASLVWETFSGPEDLSLCLPSRCPPHKLRLYGPRSRVFIGERGVADPRCALTDSLYPLGRSPKWLAGLLSRRKFRSQRSGVNWLLMQQQLSRFKMRIGVKPVLHDVVVQ